MKKQKLFFLLFFSFTLITLSQNSCEEKVNEAKKLLFENSPFTDGETIFELVANCANKGNTEAEALLGLLYLKGIGTINNDDLAFKYISKAANRGFANAQYNLGRLYKYGVGCDLDFKEAVKWFKNATENGNQRAAYSLGYMYYKGIAVAQDYRNAIYWFEQSDDYMAQHYLGLSYYLGYGVAPNEDKALEILLTNPIPNSETLVTYIENNKKEKIEQGVSQVIEENDAELENDLNIETTVTNSSTSSSMKEINKEEIIGEWEGKFIQYDWSGKTIVRIVPINLSFTVNEDSFDVTSYFEEENLSLNAIWQDDNLYFKNPFNFTLDKLFSHTPEKLTLDYRLLSLKFKKQIISNHTYLLANADTYIDEWKEYGRPSRIILKQKGNTSSLDEDLLAALAAQEEQFIKLYPVPFKNQLTVQYQLDVASTVYVELVSINGSNPIIIKPNELQQQGDYIYNISVNDNLPNGLYVVRLIAGNKVHTRLITKEN